MRQMIGFILERRRQADHLTTFQDYRLALTPLKNRFYADNVPCYVVLMQ